MRERVTYAARIYRSKENPHRYLAEFPQLNLVTQGESMDEALYMAADALETYGDGYLEYEIPLPERNLDIELREGDTLAIVSAYVEPTIDHVLTTKDVMNTLGVNKQRVHQLRTSGRISAEKYGRDYYHSKKDVERLAAGQRPAGRPKRITELAAAL